MGTGVERLAGMAMAPGAKSLEEDDDEAKRVRVRVRSGSMPVVRSETATTDGVVDDSDFVFESPNPTTTIRDLVELPPNSIKIATLAAISLSLF